MTERLPVPRPQDPDDSANLDVWLRHPSSGWTVLGVSGELDLATAARLRTILAERLSAGERVLLDAAGLRFLDAAGLRVLVEARKIAAEHGTTFALWRPGRQPNRVLHLTHLDRTLCALDALDALDAAGVTDAPA